MRIGVSFDTAQISTIHQERNCDTTEIAVDIEIQADPIRTERFDHGVTRESLRNPQWKSMPLLFQ